MEFGPSSGAGAFPNAPVTRLLGFNAGGQHLLRASTYGRGVWQNSLATLKDFNASVSNSPMTAFVNQHKNLSGTLSFFNGYTGTVTLTCTAGATAPPSTCNITPPSTNSAGPITVDVASSTVGVFDFNIHATDGTITHDLPVSLDVNDYALSVFTTQPLVVLRGGSAMASIKVQSSGDFNSLVYHQSASDVFGLP